MSIKLIQGRLDSYHSQSVQEEESALREIAQEVVLAGLSRSGFFKHAAFQGGTCLRILYGLERFSEDLDFVLIKKESDFKLKAYLEGLNRELKAYGFDCRIKDKYDLSKTLQKEFIKDSSLVKLLNFKHFKPGKEPRDINIKLEIDTNPPAGSDFEIKFHDYPFAFEIITQDKPSLFASKSHALLCREYTKGRDWYDFLWYVSRGIKVNYGLLSAAIEQAGPWKGQNITVDKAWYIHEMKNKINQTDFTKASADIKRFLKPNESQSLELWHGTFFLDRLKKLSSAL